MSKTAIADPDDERSEDAILSEEPIELSDLDFVTSVIGHCEAEDVSVGNRNRIVGQSDTYEDENETRLHWATPSEYQLN